VNAPPVTQDLAGVRPTLTRSSDGRLLFQAAGLRDVQVRPDLDGRDRVVIARA